MQDLGTVHTKMCVHTKNFKLHFTFYKFKPVSSARHTEKMNKKMKGNENEKLIWTTL